MFLEVLSINIIGLDELSCGHALIWTGFWKVNHLLNWFGQLWTSFNDDFIGLDKFHWD